MSNASDSTDKQKQGIETKFEGRVMAVAGTFRAINLSHTRQAATFKCQGGIRKFMAVAVGGTQPMV